MIEKYLKNFTLPASKYLLGLKLGSVGDNVSFSNCHEISGAGFPDVIHSRTRFLSDMIPAGASIGIVNCNN